ncbi:hypothetical protein SAMN00790413_04229 [Deinococcus hopiensis KR-140]|uniref:Uncharacterized protein n=1 Tax=Deinococcus hopiensis KR-140 TaxID=695939 RepID=A0A1W1UPU6_9DEIO|nr:hypothetical protein SAMN00790413_04229 [Deinococcus hopiensis KR-140]
MGTAVRWRHPLGQQTCPEGASPNPAVPVPFRPRTRPGVLDAVQRHNYSWALAGTCTPNAERSLSYSLRIIRSVPPAAQLRKFTPLREEGRRAAQALPPAVRVGDDALGLQQPGSVGKDAETGRGAALQKGPLLEAHGALAAQAGLKRAGTGLVAACGRPAPAVLGLQQGEVQSAPFAQGGEKGVQPRPPARRGPVSAWSPGSRVGLRRLMSGTVKGPG